MRQVYVQSFVQNSAAVQLQPDTSPGMNGAQQHRNGRQNTPLDDIYPQNPPGLIPGRKKVPATHPQHTPDNGVYAPKAPVCHPQNAQPLPARGGKHNPNVKCPCGKESYTDAKDLLVCHTCKSLNRQTLQHACCMGYDGAKITAAQRAAHMCEQCRLDHADPFWKQFGWIFPLTWLKRQVTIHSIYCQFLTVV